MSKSLFMSVDGTQALQRSLDNFYIAKLMFDAGTPFSGDESFYTDSYYILEDTLFFRGVSLLFSSLLCSNDWDDEERVEFEVRLPLMEKWTELICEFEDVEKVQEDQNYFMEPIETVECPHFELSMTTTQMHYGLKIVVEGTYAYGTFFSFMDGLVEFKNRLEQKVREYSTKRSESNGRNTHHLTGRYQISERRKAV